MDLWARLVATARDAIVSIDAAGGITSMNASAEAMFGYRVDELLGENVSVLMPSPYREEHDGYLQRYERTKEAKAIGKIRMVEGRHKSGNVFPLELAVSRFELDGDVTYSAVLRDMTEARRRERALEAAQGQLLRAQTVGGVGSFEVDLATGAVQWSTGMYAILGLDRARDEISLERILSIVHPEDRELLTDARGSIASIGEPGGSRRYGHDIRLVRPDGKLRWVETALDVENDDEGNARSVLGSFLDVTDRKVIEIELRESESNYRALFESTHDVIQVIDRDGRITFVNDAWIKTLGYSREESRGLPVVDIMSPDSALHCGEVLARVLASGEGADVSATLLARGGRSVIVEGRVEPRMQAGRVVSMQCIFRDETERVRLVAQLESRVRQQAVVAALGSDALSSGLAELMASAVKLLAETLNVELCKVLELRPSGDEFLLRSGVGWSPGLVGTATVGTELNSQAGYTLRSSKPVVVDDLRTESRFGGPELLNDHAVVAGMSVVIGSHDAPYGVLGVHTRERRAFSADEVVFLQSVANVIAEAVARQQAEKALLETQKEASRRERLADIGAIATRLAHDLGNPVAGMKMSAQRIIRVAARNPDEPVHSVERAATRIVDGADRLNALIQEFKDVARAQRLDLADVSVSELLAKTAAFWVEEADARGITLACGPSAPEVRVRADGGKLQRVLDNLVKNALEAVGEGPGDVVLSAQILEPERKVRVSVLDSGPGIPAGLDPFALFETTKAGGTGLGLPICRQIAIAHGGGIDFASSGSGGTEFRVDIPIHGPAV